MGDHNAVDIAEAFHFDVLRSGGLMRQSHLLVYPGLVPRNPEAYWEGVMIDDRVGVQVYDPQSAEEHFDSYAFAQSDRIYKDVHLETHDQKAKRQVNEATFWGCQLDGDEGMLGAPRHKIGALAAILFGFAVRGVASVMMLEMLTGQLAYVG